jgi:Putative beta-barrel porin-2, OmpL-like. bbp2
MRSVFAISVPALIGAISFVALASLPARADDQAAPAAPAPPAAPKAWTDAINLSGYLEGGVTGDFDAGSSDNNFGHLFTDKANQFLFNQGSLVFERPTDPSAGWDFGFRFQGMMGTDARYTHFLGEGDYATDQRIQFDILEASLSEHMPLFTAGGLDLKVGQFATLLGAETIDPRSNYFYSHSYIFNFGLPLKDTGAMLVSHVSPLIDLYTGVISGVNTSLGGGDNNRAAAFEGGVGFNISDSLTILATTNIGPEDSCGVSGALYDCNSTLRYYGDVVITWKINPALTSITEFNIVHDDGPFLSAGGDRIHPTAGGVAQYLVYNWSDMIAVVGRGEIFRDADGFFVTAFPGSNFDFVDCEYGKPSCKTYGTFGPTTYGELSIGLNIKPPVPDIFKGFVIRPEFRVDDALAGGKAYNWDKTSSGSYVAHSHSQETLAVDFVLPF